MRILGIETSGPAGQVALADDGHVLEVATLNAGQRHAQQLIPTIGQLLARHGWTRDSIELVSISIGPGSYTGLRVGLTAAKTLCYATGSKLVAVNTLEAIAAGAPADQTRISVVSDAQRGEVYTADFERDAPGGELHTANWAAPGPGSSPVSRAVPSPGPSPAFPVAILSVDDWAARLRPGTFVVGPALRRFRASVPPHCTIADESLWDPQAIQIIMLGLRDFRAGRRDDFWFLEPVYLRKSAAEEKWDARDAAGPS